MAPLSICQHFDVTSLGCAVEGRQIAAKVSRQTFVRFERGEAIRKRTIDSLRQVLEAAGVKFTNGREPGVA